MHFETFQVSSEAFDQPRADLKAALEKEGISQDSFFIIHIGETKIYREGQPDQTITTSGSASDQTGKKLLLETAAAPRR